MVPDYQVCLRLLSVEGRALYGRFSAVCTKRLRTFASPAVRCYVYHVFLHVR